VHQARFRVGTLFSGLDRRRRSRYVLDHHTIHCVQFRTGRQCSTRSMVRLHRHAPVAFVAIHVRHYDLVGFVAPSDGAISHLDLDRRKSKGSGMTLNSCNKLQKVYSVVLRSRCRECIYRKRVLASILSTVMGDKVGIQSLLPQLHVEFGIFSM